MTAPEWTSFLGTLTTVVAFAAFVGIVMWAWSRRNRDRFNEAARLPFALEDEIEPSARPESEP